MNLTDRELLARTIMAEAGNQGPVGMMGVGSVIMNRLRNPAYGNDFTSVILAPGQFSAWNSVTGYADGAQGQDMSKIIPSREAYMVADQILDGNYNDPTGGATHYYNPRISNPSWGQRSGGNWMQLGDHIFGMPGKKDPTRKNTMNANNAPLNAIPRMGPVTQKNSQLMQPGKPKARGLFDIIGKAVGGSFDNLKGALDGSNPEASDKLAIALMSLSGNPQQMQPLMQMAAADIQERKKMNQGRNGTVELLTRLAKRGDVRAETALKLVDSVGPAEALKTYMNAPGSTAANKTAASTIEYKNGTTVSTFQDGTKQVRDGEGRLLTGQSALEAIKIAQANEIEQAGLEKFETESANIRANKVDEILKKTEGVSSQLRNFNIAKNALREAIANGQNISGFAAQFMPNVSLQAQELDFARNSLGLDVVGSVTFGALSKGELDLALRTALPVNLNERQLLEYIERRELALTKYQQSLVAAARWYATPGNKLADFEQAVKQVEKPNLYKETSDDELLALVAEVRSGMSTLPPETRQMILDEAERRAGR